jgi:hypothetical protein
VHTDGKTPNVIAVQATNQIPSSRWYSGSGIYRKVRIVVTDPVHVARHGTYVTTPDVAATIGAGYADVSRSAIRLCGRSTAPSSTSRKRTWPRAGNRGQYVASVRYTIFRI